MFCLYSKKKKSNETTYVLPFSIHLFLHHYHQQQHKQNVNALVQQCTHKAKFSPVGN